LFVFLFFQEILKIPGLFSLEFKERKLWNNCVKLFQPSYFKECLKVLTNHQSSKIPQNLLSNVWISLSLFLIFLMDTKCI